MVPAKAVEYASDRSVTNLARTTVELHESGGRGNMLTKEFEEGAEAGRKGLSFAKDCPYTFDRSNMTPEQFNNHQRARLNAWFDGWKTTQAVWNWAGQSNTPWKRR